MRRIVKHNLDIFTFRQKMSANYSRMSQTVIIISSIYFDISKQLRIPFRIKNNNGNCIVFIDNLQHQFQISVLIGHIQRAHSFSPNLHPTTLFLGQVSDQKMGYDKRSYSYQHSCNNQ